jgi:hypothetical protein
MTKHKWHIVLVQETGVITSTSPCPEQAIARKLEHHISFNSPSLDNLRSHQLQKRVATLTALFDNGKINCLQWSTECELAKGVQVFPSGGLAIMVHSSVLSYMQINCTFSPGPDGDTLIPCDQTMALSTSINSTPTCIFNVYTLSTSHHDASEWINLSLLPMIQEGRQHGWESVVGGDFNATLAPIDQGNP